MLINSAGKIALAISAVSFAQTERHSTELRMAGGRKSAKGSFSQTKSTSKKAGGSSSKVTQVAKSALVEVEDLGCPPVHIDNDLEGLDEAKLSELSADEPESSECK